MAILDYSSLSLKSTQASQGMCGVPVVDGSRLWALWVGGSMRSAPEIMFSDDFGDTWTSWATLPATGENVLNDIGRGAVLMRDSAGNCYYNSITGTNPGVRGISRIDASTKAATRCFDFHVESALAPSEDWWTYAFTWNWTVDLAGRVFVSQYGLQYWNGSGWSTAGMTDFDSHFIWRSNVGGTSWERVDLFVALQPDCRHVHACHVNPYNGKMYVAIGDTPKVFYVSDDALETATIITGAAETGYTGLTFTVEGVYCGDDLVSGTKVWRTTNDSTMAIVYDPPSVWKAPMYYLRSVGPDELWFTIVNDGQYSGARSSLVRLAKSGVNGSWSATTIMQAPTATFASTIPYDISHDGRGIIPDDHPYVYVHVTNWGTGLQGVPEGTYRVQRVTDEVLNTEFSPLSFDLFTAAEALAGEGLLSLTGDGTLVYESDGATYYDLTFAFLSAALPPAPLSASGSRIQYSATGSRQTPTVTHTNRRT